MKKGKRAGLFACFALLVSGWMAAPSSTLAAYPEKPIRTVTVENRPGATGVIGSQAVARAQPDGYTLLLGYDGTIVIAPALNADFPFDTRKDLKPVSKLADVGLVVAIHPSIPANNIKELIDYSKLQSSRVSFATPGVGVPAASRHHSLPDVPTFSEAGIDGLDAASWFGLFAPDGTPDAVVDRLNTEVTRLLADENISERLRNAALEPTPSTPAQFGALIDSDLTKWSKVAREADLSN